MTMTEYHFGELGRQIRDAIDKDLDAKIIITSSNSKPGLGKTTLAIEMARTWDPYGWDAEDKAFLSVHEYHQAYLSKPSGTVLILDEIEAAADSRRSMSKGNVQLSQAWAKERFRNIISITTLPSVTMLDNRILELADYWINVRERGLAHPYKIYVNDFDGRVYRKRMLDGNAVIHFTPLPDDDPDKEYLDTLKKVHSELDRDLYSEKELEKRINQAEKDAKLDTRNEMIRNLYDSDDLDLSQSQIANLEFVDLTQPTVADIINHNA